MLGKKHNKMLPQNRAASSLIATVEKKMGGLEDLETKKRKVMAQGAAACAVRMHPSLVCQAAQMG